MVVACEGEGRVRPGEGAGAGSEVVRDRVGGVRVRAEGLARRGVDVQRGRRERCVEDG